MFLAHQIVNHLEEILPGAPVFQIYSSSSSGTADSTIISKTMCVTIVNFSKFAHLLNVIHKSNLPQYDFRVARSEIYALVSAKQLAALSSSWIR